jgi:hypothetical protein
MNQISINKKSSTNLGISKKNISKLIEVNNMKNDRIYIPLPSPTNKNIFISNLMRREIQKNSNSNFDKKENNNYNSDNGNDFEIKSRSKSLHHKKLNFENTSIVSSFDANISQNISNYVSKYILKDNISCEKSNKHTIYDDSQEEDDLNGENNLNDKWFNLLKKSERENLEIFESKNTLENLEIEQTEKKLDIDLDPKDINENLNCFLPNNKIDCDINIFQNDEISYSIIPFLLLTGKEIHRMCFSDYRINSIKTMIRKKFKNKTIDWIDYYKLGIFKIYQGKYYDAFKYFKRSEKINPNENQIKKWICFCLLNFIFFHKDEIAEDNLKKMNQLKKDKEKLKRNENSNYVNVTYTNEGYLKLSDENNGDNLDYLDCEFLNDFNLNEFKIDLFELESTKINNENINCDLYEGNNNQNEYERKKNENNNGDFDNIKFFSCCDSRKETRKNKRYF